jgi:hypothetical protein
MLFENSGLSMEVDPEESDHGGGHDSDHEQHSPHPMSHSDDSDGPATQPNAPTDVQREQAYILRTASLARNGPMKLHGVKRRRKVLADCSMRHQKLEGIQQRRAARAAIKASKPLRLLRCCADGQCLINLSGLQLETLRHEALAMGLADKCLRVTEYMEQSGKRPNINCDTVVCSLCLINTLFGHLFVMFFFIF